jgi:ribonuclease P protein component
MLPRKNRLNIRQYFNEVRGHGKKLAASNFSVYIRLKQDSSKPEFSTIISKKVSKSAVSRNRIRRLIHTALSKLIENIDPRTQGLIFVYKNFADLKSDIVTKELEQLLKQAGLLNKNGD